MFLLLQEEAARATPIPLTPSRPTAKASNRAMACCTSRSLAKQATTSRAPLASRVKATPTRCKALPLALLPVRAAHPCRLALRVHATKQATTPRAVRVSRVLQEA